MQDKLDITETPPLKHIYKEETIMPKNKWQLCYHEACLGFNCVIIGKRSAHYVAIQYT